MVLFETMYPGSTYPLESTHLLDPSYNFLGYRVPVSEMGGTTSIQTANQLKEVSKLLNQGMKTTEVSVIQPEVFEMIPDENLKEIKRLNELTGAESTLHAPLIEPSGVDTQQGGWSEQNRVAAEEQLKQVIERSNIINKQGNMPVTVHASNLPGTEEIPGKKGREMGRMIAIDQESGKPTNLEREWTYYPEYAKFEAGKKAEGIIFTPEERLRSINNTQWRKTITDLDFYKKEADDIINRVYPDMVAYLAKKKAGETIAPEEEQKYSASREQMQRAGRFMENVDLSFKNVFEKAARFSDLDKGMEDPRGRVINDEKGNPITPRRVLSKVSDDWKKLRKDAMTGKLSSDEEYILRQSQLLDRSMNTLQQLPPPKQFIQIEDFAKDKSSETLANVALHAYKKFGEKAPIVSVENPPYGMAIASGKDLKELIKQTRNKFVEKAVKEGKSKSEAQRAAERLIGATWDTSHISMMRKQGFEKKDVTAETKEIAKYVKHLHYNDNFGSTHTDLPPGMGSLPMKDILNELKKGGFKGKKIFEGGNFFQHFQTSPFVYTLETGGAPVYEGGPSWNQVWGYFSPYYAGHGPVNPAIHHQTYGAGFQTLPLELGGEMPGGRDRLSGAPMQ